MIGPLIIELTIECLLKPRKILRLLLTYLKQLLNCIFVCSKHAHSAMENLKKFPRITPLFQEGGEGKEQEGRKINSTTFT